MTDKKKVLFVINNLRVGGAEKALISLLNEIDYSRLQVDLLLFRQQGAFMGDIPKEVQLLKEPLNYQYFDGPFINVIKTLNPFLIYQRWRFKKLMIKGKNPAEAEQFAWDALKKTLPKLKKEYDVAIGFLEKNPIYYVVDKVKAKKKIGFIHNDYISLGLNKQIDLPYFEKLNSICSISQKCVDVLVNEFPSLVDKINLVPNIVSQELLTKKAMAKLDESFWINSTYNIVSVGRLEKQKGFEISIKTAKILHERGIDFRWYVFGEGTLRLELETLINDLGLMEQFVLVGLHTNPIKFMNKADLIVQTSLFEGKSIVIDEAKVLAKPIILTNYPTAKDQIINGETGVISDTDPDTIANSIIKIKEDLDFRNELIVNLQNELSKNEFGKLKIMELL